MSVRIFRSLEEARTGFGPSSLTVGNFDGVHAGHVRILRRVCEVGREKGCKPSVLTFDPHPTKVVAPSRSPRLITTPEQRCYLMEQHGIQQVLILPFTPQVAQLTPEQFARDVLVRALDVKAVLVGENFRFGHKHAGDTRLLRELGAQLGFEVEVVPGVPLRRAMISSSEIRRLIESGNVSRAAETAGIDRKTFYRLLRKHQMAPEKFRGH